MKDRILCVCVFVCETWFSYRHPMVISIQLCILLLCRGSFAPDENRDPGNEQANNSRECIPTHGLLKCHSAQNMFPKYPLKNGKINLIAKTGQLPLPNSREHIGYKCIKPLTDVASKWPFKLRFAHCMVFI